LNAPTPRIETAEVLSFRLKVPPSGLQRLAEGLKPSLGVQLEPEESELVLSMGDGDSYLRFRPIGAEAILTEVCLSKDEEGVFFHRVLGTLMVEYGGDLHLRLTWNTPERNLQGDHAEVRIIRGATSYPGLRATAEVTAGGGAGGDGVSVESSGSDRERPPSQLEKEVNEILDRARKHWEEYQRLKAQRK
jgi:hypothetical protein